MTSMKATFHEVICFYITRDRKWKWAHLTEPGPNIHGSKSKFGLNGWDPRPQDIDIVDGGPNSGLNIIINFIRLFFYYIAYVIAKRANFPQKFGLQFMGFYSSHTSKAIN